jgi:hypothetical protein
MLALRPALGFGAPFWRIFCAISAQTGLCVFEIKHFLNFSVTSQLQ